jgi:hypothetical protein
MDFDFFDRQFINESRRALVEFREAVERFRPAEEDMEELCKAIHPYQHCTRLNEDFSVAAVDGSGEFPILQQDDIFVHLAIASGKFFRTESGRQHKLSTGTVADGNFRGFVVLRDDTVALRESYARFLNDLVGLSLRDLVVGSDYCEVFSQFGKPVRPSDVTWDRITMSRASQISSHEYLLRTVAELGVALRLLATAPKYLLIDTSMVYFFLGERPFLPEVVKRYLICKARNHGTCVMAISKSHNIPNGDLIGRWAKEKHGFKDHWYLRLPSEALGEVTLPFLKEKEVPPKLCVSYLFKFHGTSFPMRLDLDAKWWKEQINFDQQKEERLFAELDYTCHDVRSYGYPYPLHAAHRTASLTKQERKAIRDILLQNAKEEGLLRGAFLRDPESIHQGGI